MSGATGLGSLFLGAALLIAAFGETSILGLSPRDFAVLCGFFGIALVMTGWVLNEFRASRTEGFRALIVWSGIFAILITGYVRRGEIAESFDRMIGEVAAGRAVTNEAGEVVVARGSDGSFLLVGQVNGRDARFIFDTGATAVVLTAESARAAGFKPDSIAYTVPVFTANGRTLAAPVTLETLTVGAITVRRVRALIARPDALRENLLGMTFLDRLNSYEVRGNRLILRPKV